MAAIAIVLLAAGNANAEDAITGKWRTPNGDTASIRACGSGYCIISETGARKGRQIGQFSATKDGYSGELTDPTSDRTYAGTGSLSGSSLKLTGCALRIFCRSQTWTRL